MIFFFLIIFPFLIPVVYFLCLWLVFVLSGWWYALLAAVLVLNAIYFLILIIRNKDKLKFLLLFLFYSSFFMAAGFIFVLIMTSDLAINIFSILWALVLVIFLYAVFHFSYETKSRILIEIKNIIPYINVASLFVVAATLININIFLALSWWAVLLIFIGVTFMFNWPFMLLYENDFKTSILYNGIITLIMAEVMAATLYLPAGFYVLGAVVALIYYLVAILMQKKLEGQLVRKKVAGHLVFVVILLIIILATSQWI
jgi:hypothetical protein